MILPNRCSFGAHQRMHRSRPPHVCPECGGNFLLPSFQSHLRESCLHFSAGWATGWDGDMETGNSRNVQGFPGIPSGERSGEAMER
ncbi:hypothetical protein DUI87_00235 [Hirundo rustica rustica]|uniref:C2H2-type domain-containing protein n=1 Tax=Hirundo rustica rustica TaxID=333673 RepID=A0A3M0LBU3_HIRRU|nr:hypothetical protein DUI87_00235 [Hirundo rustica rustica]